MQDILSIHSSSEPVDTSVRLAARLREEILLHAMRPQNTNCLPASSNPRPPVDFHVAGKWDTGILCWVSFLLKAHPSFGGFQEKPPREPNANFGGPSCPPPNQKKTANFGSGPGTAPSLQRPGMDFFRAGASRNSMPSKATRSELLGTGAAHF